MDSMSSKEVIVLGMHRSGTSMIGGVLSHLGVNLGEDLPGKQISNPLGHFEDGDFLALNQTILENAGGYWDQPPEKKNIELLHDKFKEPIQALVSDRKWASGEEIWGWKDPRTSLTIELFIPYLDNPHFIICRRDPSEIITSLWQRNRMTEDEARQLVDTYYQRIDDFFRKHSAYPVLELEYNELIESPESGVIAICDFLEIHPSQEEMDRAISFILPRRNIRFSKLTYFLSYLLSLPRKAFQRFFFRS
jgi:hypothetical protein